MAYWAGDEEGGPRGYGRTEADAITDLTRNFDEPQPLGIPPKRDPVDDMAQCLAFVELFFRAALDPAGATDETPSASQCLTAIETVLRNYRASLDGAAD